MGFWESMFVLVWLVGTTSMPSGNVYVCVFDDVYAWAFGLCCVINADGGVPGASSVHPRI